MACPYFFPTARLENAKWEIPPRLPLGDAYAGECRATPARFQPDEPHLKDFCNVGYGRGSCGQFPSDGLVDAVRFHIRDESNERIRIQSVAEKDCWPAGASELECATAPREIRGTDDEILAKQALVFVESYLRRKEQALGMGA
jgi:hypothetical protein